MILLTGHTSYIGKEIQKLPYKFRLLQNRLEQMTAGDVADINTVIHLAAITHTREREKYFQVNTEGTKNLIRLCKNTNVHNFIFISTIAASKECGDYGFSKSLAEHCVAQSGIPYTILRLGQVYDPEYKQNNFYCRYKRLAKLPIVPYIPGVIFNPVPIERVVGKIREAIHKPENTTCTLADEQVPMKHGIQGMPIPIPLFIIKLFFPLACSLGFMSPDQLPRLICKKHVIKP